MSASEFLRKEHQEIMRLEKVITKSYKALYDGVNIPFSHIDKIKNTAKDYIPSPLSKNDLVLIETTKGTIKIKLFMV